MSGLADDGPDDDGPGITRKQTTHISSVDLGTGANKYVTMGNYASPGNAEFTFVGLHSAGGPGDYAEGYYAIVYIPDFSAKRLYDELLLQFDFSDVVLDTLADGSKITLSPRIFGLHIEHRGTYYGRTDILANLLSLAKSPDGDNFNFTVAEERVNYNMGNGNVETPARVINKDPDKLIQLIGYVLRKGKILLDIKIPNLLVRCYNRSCYLGVMDLDNKFTGDIGFGWYPLKGLVDAFLGTVSETLAEQYMVFMVCFVGANNGLLPTTKTKLLHQVGLITDKSDITTFRVKRLNVMLRYDMLQTQIRYYLDFHPDVYKTTKDVSDGFMSHYIRGEKLPVGTPGRTQTMTPTRSSEGGKSRRKRKPKSRKTRRKRSLLNRAKMWDR